jgi:FMN phosphatase YigB (HAD superfamily)
MVSDLPDLLVFDFDGTIANTFVDSPNGMNVEKAYRSAIEDLFGESGLKKYDGQGDLNNRAPGEVVASLACPQDNTEALVELLVKKKLEYLLKEINQKWPLPTAGFLEFWQTIMRDAKIKTAILSSGHEEFIKKSFKAQGIRIPNAMVTDDDIRHREGYPNEWVKPSSRVFDLLMEKFFKEELFKEVIYFGDDPLRDGGLAWNAGVHFGWFNPEGKPAPPDLKNFFQFKNWMEVLEKISIQ